MILLSYPCCLLRSSSAKSYSEYDCSNFMRKISVTDRQHKIIRSIIIIDAGETLAHTPTPYRSKQMNRLRSSLSPIQYHLSSPQRETIVFDLFPPPLRFSDISKIEGLLNYILGSELTTKKPMKTCKLCQLLCQTLGKCFVLEQFKHRTSVNNSGNQCSLPKRQRHKNRPHSGDPEQKATTKHQQEGISS